MPKVVYEKLRALGFVVFFFNQIFENLLSGDIIFANKFVTNLRIFAIEHNLFKKT